MYRRDSILSEIRESVAILTERVIAGFPQRENRRLSPSPAPKRIPARKDSDQDRTPQVRKRNTAAPYLRTPKHSPERGPNQHGATVSRARGHSPATNNGEGLHQPLSPQQQIAAPSFQQHTPQRRHSPPARGSHGSPQLALAPDRSAQQRHLGSAGGGGCGDEVEEVRPPDKRSPSPPSPPSRSQPLRALVDCGGCSINQDDRDNDHDDDGGSAHGFRTPERGRRHRGKLGDPRGSRRGGQRGEGGGKESSGQAANDAVSPSPSPLPRANDLKSVRRAALEKQKPKAAKTTALVKSGDTDDSRGTLGVQHRGRHGRRTLHHPSWYDPTSANKSVPESALALEYVFGYAGETPEVLVCSGGGSKSGAGGGGGYYGRPGGRSGGDFVPGGGVGGGMNSATRSTNVVWLRSGEVVFPASAVVVIHDFETNRQRFFTGHDEASVLRGGLG